MEHVHHCLFCGFQRPAASAAIVRPHCEGCGSVLRSASAHELERPAGEGASEIAYPGRLTRASRRAAALAGFATLEYFSIRVGHAGGGAWLAMTAGALGVFACLPLLPKSV